MFVQEVFKRVNKSLLVDVSPTVPRVGATSLPISTLENEM
jgi:hypothetical protein